MIQPYYPRKPLIKPREIMDISGNFRRRSNFVEYPQYDLKPMPEGVYFIRHGHDGSFDCQQIYSNGLFCYYVDVLRSDGERGINLVYISHILGALFTVLASAIAFYNEVGYQGLINLNIEVSFKSTNLVIQRLVGNNPFNWGGREEMLLPKYNWEFKISTTDLNHKDELLNQLFQIANDIHWSLGFKDLNIDLLKAFINQLGLNF
jgi:hypothetical protein